jgi:hypothetical protein
MNPQKKPNAYIPWLNIDPEKIEFAFKLQGFWEAFLDSWDDEEEPTFAQFMLWITDQLEKASASLDAL